MITTKHGSIFDSRAQVLVCPVNCVGVMGKGLALEFKRRFPNLEKRYKAMCTQDGYGLKPGDIAWGMLSPSQILLAATKKHWRNPTNIVWVETILGNTRWLGRMPDSIAIPQLGCGCGGLDWADVEPLYRKHLGGLDIDVEVWIHE